MKRWEFRPAKDHGLSPKDRLRSLQRESGLMHTTGHLLWWSIVRTYLAAYHRLEIHGREHIPTEPPFVLVSNHESHLDTLVLSAPLRWTLRDKIFPIAAGDTFFETPVTTVFASAFLNALPMWRRNCGPHALAELKKRLLEEPCSYILFPEGTRSRDGSIVPFKPGLGLFVAGTPVPVVPCHVEGCFEALSPQQKWPRPGKLTLRVGTPLVFGTVGNDRTGWKEVARVTEDAVRELAAAGE